MKKVILSFSLLIFLISFSSAVSIEMDETYQRGETIIAEIFGNLLRLIEKEDVQLFRKHIQVPIDYDVKRIGERHYFYGIAPLNEENYTLKINNILTNVEGVEMEIDFEQNFSTTSELVSYSLKPGFAIFEKDFEFSLTLNDDLNKEISIDFPESRVEILSPGENKVKINSVENDTGFKLINIGDYKVPIFILESPEEKENSTTNISIFPRRLESILFMGERKVYPIKITNLAESKITDLMISYNEESLNITPQIISLINSNETIEVNLTLKTINETISEVIIFETEDFYEKIEIHIEYTENEGEVTTPYLDENYIASQGYYCSELGGNPCSAGDICSEDTLQTLDINECCLGECSAPGESSFAWIGFIIGLIILIVLVIVGVRYKKSKGQTKSKNPLGNQIIKAKSSNPIFSKKP